MRVLLFDTETTGLPLPAIAPLAKQPRIIEIGAILMTTDGNIIRELGTLINPKVAISEEITKITGIKTADLIDSPTFERVLPGMKAMFACANMLIAHNLPFDKSMLEFELSLTACEDFPWPEQLVCTSQEYAPRFGHRISMEPLYMEICGQPLKQTHRALDDVQRLREILLKDNFFKRIGAA